jgi:hypothetical protein
MPLFYCLSTWLLIMCSMCNIFNGFKIILLQLMNVVWFSVTFNSLFTNFIPNVWPTLHDLSSNLLLHSKKSLIFILMLHYTIDSLQTYVDKMTICAKCRGLWGDNHAIFCLTHYLWKHIYVWSKKHCVICLHVGDNFIKQNPL